MPKYYVELPNKKIVINAKDSFSAVLNICKNHKLSLNTGDKIIVNETGFIQNNENCTIFKILRDIK
jgi:hypothetical protein